MTDDDHWSGERRRVDASFFRNYLGDGLNASSYMVAGPPGMAAAATEAAAATDADSAGAEQRSVAARFLRRLRRGAASACAACGRTATWTRGPGRAAPTG